MSPIQHKPQLSRAEVAHLATELAKDYTQEFAPDEGWGLWYDWFNLKLRDLCYTEPVVRCLKCDAAAAPNSNYCLTHRPKPRRRPRNTVERFLDWLLGVPREAPEL